MGVFVGIEARQRIGTPPAFRRYNLAMFRNRRTIKRIVAEMADQAALEQHKWDQRATLGEIYASRAASYERIAKMVEDLTGKPHPMKNWLAVRIMEQIIGL
jgi:hypothetical protein